MLSDRRPVLSVTLVYCGQTVGRIKMKLGFGLGHIVLDGDLAPTPPKGHSPQFSAHICCCKMAGLIKMPLGTEVGLGPGHIVLDGDPAPPPQKGTAAPNFGPCVLWPNGSMDQDATWYGARPRPWRHFVRWGLSPGVGRIPFLVIIICIFSEHSPFAMTVYSR